MMKRIINLAISVKVTINGCMTVTGSVTPMSCTIINQPSVLRFENRILLSQEGPHQGDLLGPLLFRLSIHPDLLRLQSELVDGFMDDLTLGGPTDKVAADIDYIRDREQRTGLRINASKSEIICSGSTLGQYSSTSSSLWHLTRQIIWVPHFSQAKYGHSSGQPLH